MLGKNVSVDFGKRYNKVLDERGNKIVSGLKRIY